MKKININLRDRKNLSLVLCLVLICVFTLTIAYSALSAVLTIQGNARVSAADWDIYLNNPRVIKGSATTNLPVIKTSSTLEFETTLNRPGDFYEFVVDVVNGGDIDAMIENVVKIPDLTAEQSKFLKYEVSYQNGESITSKQLLAKDTTMPIKVRIEYRKDLNNYDLPTGQVVLDLALTLEYVQSDGSGSSVKDNGVYKPVSANGDVTTIGTIVTIGSEQFYTIGTEGDNIKLFSMYNLYVGGEYDYSTYELTYYGDEATGMQDSTMKGWDSVNDIRRGITKYSDYSSNYTFSFVKTYIDNYKNALEDNFNVEIVEARPIKTEELTSSETFGCSLDYYCRPAKYPWIYSTSYWTGTAYDSTKVWYITAGYGMLGNDSAINKGTMGVRPVIVISKDYFN